MDYSYAYGPMRRRWLKTNNLENTNTQFYWADSNVMGENNNGVQRRYIFEGITPLAFIEQNQLYHYLRDHLGTAHEIVDANGNIVWQSNYQSFGELSVVASTVENNLRFSGQYHDQETGLYYNLTRYYDPVIGGYAQSDTLGLFDGPNTYAYAHQNPLIYTDPAGEFVPQLIGFAIGAGLEYLTNPCASATDLLLAGGLGALGGGLSKAAFLRYGPRSLTRVHGKVWSHSISRKAVNRYTRGGLNKALNKRGGLNGSWVNPRRHHLHDKAATIRGGGRKLPLPLRAADRIPDWLKGTAASGAADSAAAGSSSECDCKK
ncbi:hypothetical protein AB835_04020 [Candidatus Endobugula sertula]|uniref:RHS protein conserved region domain-containing protein n=1 Tax=Candidatus Endobugula sertula TaxID=62101 RepID=A0A1D2QRX8_9GAMM|nr:hypothetical protein AB835_04020 [Candidatus Endobugula sertula]